MQEQHPAGGLERSRAPRRRRRHEECARGIPVTMYLERTRVPVNIASWVNEAAPSPSSSSFRHSSSDERGRRKELAERLEMTTPAVREKLKELQTVFHLEREEDHPHVYWSVPRTGFPVAWCSARAAPGAPPPPLATPAEQDARRIARDRAPQPAEGRQRRVPARRRGPADARRSKRRTISRSSKTRPRRGARSGSATSRRAADRCRSGTRPCTASCSVGPHDSLRVPPRGQAEVARVENILSRAPRRQRAVPRVGPKAVDTFTARASTGSMPAAPLRSCRSSFVSRRRAGYRRTSCPR